MRHIDNSGHTETAINIYPDMATIHVSMLPGYRAWSRPTAQVIRRWVDANIAESENRNRKRADRIEFVATSGGWRATVKLVQS